MESLYHINPGKELYRPGMLSFPPSPSLYIGPDEYIRIPINSSNPTATFELHGMMMDFEGRMRQLFTKLPLTPDRNQYTTWIKPGEGWLLSLIPIVYNFFPVVGQVVVRACIQQGALTLGFSRLWIFGGNLGRDYAPCFPPGIHQIPIDGPGWNRSVAGTAPAVAAEISETVPDFALWRLTSFSAVLTTDANVANRQVFFTIDDGTDIICKVPAGAVQPAGTVTRYTFGPFGTLNTTLVNGMIVPSPNAGRLWSGWRINTVTLNMQAGDQWSAPQYSVEEWIDQTAGLP